jgi:hypothetical protein
MSAFTPGVFDIYWDDPSFVNGPRTGNSQFSILGVNIYRSDISDRGPYQRINVAPVGGNFFRDQAQRVLISNEPVTSWLDFADAPNDRRWVFVTKNPIIRNTDEGPYDQPIYANTPTDITLTINGEEVPVDFVFGKTGEVRLINRATFDFARDKFKDATLPTNSSDIVLVSYYTSRNFIRSGLDTKIFYRVTTVALDSNTPSGLIESPLSYAEPHSNIEIEKLDYIWREAIRRNHWILDQGGERAKVFIRKRAGVPCCCNAQVEAWLKEFSKQPSQRCEVCFGTGYEGGYEGPYDIIMAPDDAERRISQLNQGRRLEHTYEVWTGPTPLLTQRDFIVRQTNERYSVGPVRKPSARGNVMQQHFNIAYLDEQDMRYQVPLGGMGTSSFVYPETRHTHPPHESFAMNYIDEQGEPYVIPEPRPVPPYQEGPTAVNPTITEKDNIDAERPAWEGEKRMRTQTGENIEY